MSNFDFFVSHAGSDAKWAGWIAAQLQNVGFSVLLDIWNWSAGEDVVKAMADGLDRAERVIAIYSEAYFSRQFAQQEFRAAFHNTTQSEKPRIVPVVVEECDVPELYSTLLQINLIGLNETAARQRLLEGVGAIPVARNQGFPGDAFSSKDNFANFALAPGDGREDVYPGSLPRTWNLPPRNPFFCGREPLLAEIRHRLEHASFANSPLRAVSLKGMGGVGKTQIAREYAYRNVSNYGHLIWWVDSDKSDRMVDGLTQLAASLAISGATPEEKIKNLWAVLSSSNGWLIIYDNVDEPNTIADGLTPPNNGHWLITSRSAAIGRIAPTIEVMEFSREESLELLQSRAPSLATTQAGAIAASLGDLPLAVEQAGCFLAETGFTAADYLDLLYSSPVDAGLNDPTTQRHPGLSSVVGTSLDRLQERHPLVARALGILSLLAPEPVPIAPSREGSTHNAWEFGLPFGDAKTTAVMVRELARSGLVTRAGRQVQLHRVVQILIIAQLNDQLKDRLTWEAAILLSKARPGIAARPQDWTSFAMILPHVEALLERGSSIVRAGENLAFSELVINCINYCYRSGRYVLGENLATTCLPIWRAELGDRHVHSLRVENNLGACLVGQQRYDEAVVLFRGLRDKYSLTLGANHHRTLWTSVNIGAALIGARRYREAVTDLTIAAEGLRTVNSPFDSEYLRAADNLARALVGAGRQEEAIALAQEVLVTRHNSLDPVHPDTLESAYTLGVALAKHRPRESKRLLEETLEQQRQVLGPAHPETRRTEKYLADGELEL
jgi:hypothetical protein